jgi:hypothetical protein
MLSSSVDLSEEDNNENPVRQQDVQMNWLHRFLHIKPAVKVLCFQVGRKKARRDISKLLKDWQRFGVRDLNCDKNAFTITARVDKDNRKCNQFLFVEWSLQGNVFCLRFEQLCQNVWCNVLFYHFVRHADSFSV